MILLLFLVSVVICQIDEPTTVGEFIYCEGESDLGLWPQGDWGDDNDWYGAPPDYGDLPVGSYMPSSRKYWFWMPLEPTDEMVAFGGYGFDRTNGASNPKQGLWKRKMDSGEWVRLYGSSDHWGGFGDEGRYSTMWPSFLAATSSRAGGMTQFASARGPDYLGASHPVGDEWMHNNTYFIYGGLGYAHEREQGPGPMDSLWLLSHSEMLYRNHPWSLIQGTNSYSSFEQLGLEGIADARNITYNISVIPRARYGCSGMSTENGKKFLVFGGSFGLSTDVTNELWEYKLKDVQEGWRVLRGNIRLSNDPGIFGTKGEWGYNNIPPARARSTVWAVEGLDDDELRIFVYGGTSNVPFVYWSDMWEFSMDRMEWRWISGDMILQKRPNYDAGQKFFSDSVYPGSRASTSPFIVGNSLMFYGGVGVDSSGSAGPMSDIWAYGLGNRQWMWVDGSEYSGSEGSYVDPIYPSGHYGNGFMKFKGTYYLGGGVSNTDLAYCNPGQSTVYTQGMINDFWSFDIVEMCNGYYVYDEMCCNAKGTCNIGNCTCLEEYEGINCETKKLTCEGVLSDVPSVCSGRGDCLHEEICTCYPETNGGYYGQFCKVNIKDIFETRMHDSVARLELDYQMKDDLIPVELEGIFDCYLVIRPVDVYQNDSWWQNTSDPDVANLYLDWLGLNASCEFTMHPINVTTTEFLVVNYGQSVAQVSSQAALQRGEYVNVKIVNAYEGPVGNFDSWREVRLRPAPNTGSGETGTFWEWLGKFMLQSSAGWILLICCCCCCCCLTYVVCTIWIYIVLRQRAIMKKFDDFDEDEVESLIVDQIALLDSNFNEVRQGKLGKKIFNIKFGDIFVEKAVATGGSNAIVFKAVYKKKDVALKLFKTKDIETQESYDCFVKEADLLRKLQHPNILIFYGCTLDEPRVGLVMEWCRHGDVRNYVLNEDNPIFDTREKLLIINQICDCMAFLNGREIIHRDLKWDNVMFNDKIVPKLIDFGLSKKLEGASANTYMTRQAGTSQYMAPEVTLSTTYGFKCDVFSMAIMMYELLTEDFEPYGRFPEFNIELKVALNPDFRPKIRGHDLAAEECMEPVIEIMVASWQAEEEERPGFDQIRDTIRENLNEIGELIKPYDENVRQEYERRKEMKKKLLAKELDTDQKM